MARAPHPVAQPGFGRCGHLRLERVEAPRTGLRIEALHARPHFGYVVHGRFAITGVDSEVSFAAGDLRVSAHVEGLQMDLAPGFEGLVGELVGIAPLPPTESTIVRDDSSMRDCVARVATDPTHPDLVEIERWMLAQRSRVARAGRAASWIEDLVLELQGAPLESRIVRAWSDRSGRHRSTLHRSFRQTLGIDPSGWILRERLRRAWQRLETEEPLVEIAIDCGFADQSHMNRVFRRFTDWTPGALRNDRRQRTQSPLRPGSKTRFPA